MDTQAFLTFVLGGASSPIVMKAWEAFANRGTRTEAAKRRELTDLARERARSERERDHRIELSLWGLDLEILLRHHGVPYPPRPDTPAALKGDPQD